VIIMEETLEYTPIFDPLEVDTDIVKLKQLYQDYKNKSRMLEGQFIGRDDQDDLAQEVAQEVSAQEVSAQEVSAQEVSAQEVSAQEVSAQEVAVKKVSKKRKHLSHVKEDVLERKRISAKESRIRKKNEFTILKDEITYLKQENRVLSAILILRRYRT
jgi:hypothetical protein